MFRISRRLDYGLQLMIALAAEDDCKPQSTASLAKKLSIPLPFLHQISHSLMQAGFIKATPGPRGGVKLNQPASSISVRQIVEVLEGPISLNPDNSDCEQLSLTKDLWKKMEDQVIEYLDLQKLDKMAKNSQGIEILPFSFKKKKQEEKFLVN